MVAFEQTLEATITAADRTVNDKVLDAFSNASLYSLLPVIDGSRTKYMGAARTGVAKTTIYATFCNFGTIRPKFQKYS